MRTQLSVNEVEPQEGQQRQAKPVPQITVIIPAYNEEEGLLIVLSQLFSVIDETYEVIVVDDGSTDGTGDAAARFSCRIVRQPQNLGKGAAMRSGFEVARSEKIIFIDADDQHPVDIIPQMAYALDRYDMAVASRTGNSDRLPVLNRIGNLLFRNMIRHLYNYKPHDPLTGLIAIRRTHLMNMNLDSTGFAIETEITIKSASMGLDVLEIPIYHRKRTGNAKLHGLRDGYHILLTIVKMLALYNPNLTFTVPGGLMLAAGMTLMAVLMTRPVNVADVGLGIHSFVLAAMLSVAGFQVAVFGFAMKAYALAYKFTKHDLISRLVMREHVAKVVFGLGVLVMLVSVSLGAWVGVRWVADQAIPFDRAKGLILFASLAVLGLNAAISAVFLSVFLQELGKIKNHGSAKGTLVDG